MNCLIMRPLPNNGQVMYNPLMTVMFSHDIVVLLFIFAINIIILLLC